jgi:hypothetical protein
LDLPILRIVTKYGNFSNKILDELTFKYYFQQIIRNAGYYRIFIIYALRRALANAVDSKFSSFLFAVSLYFPRVAVWFRVANRLFFEQKSLSSERKINFLAGFYLTCAINIIFRISAISTEWGLFLRKNSVSIILRNFEALILSEYQIFRKICR